jgi:arginase
MSYICIGVPYFLGAAIVERTEVAAVRDSGIAAELGADWVDVVADSAVHADPVNAVNARIANVIKAHPDRVPLLFASDCMCTLGAMAGLAARQPSVLWYDAHGDFNTPETTITNFLGGMPLAALVGKGNRHLLDGIGASPCAESRVSLTDARNLDEAEAELLANSDIAHLRYIGDVQSLDWGGEPLYIHVDLDVLDPAEMPALDYPTPNGASLEALLETLRHARAHANVVGVSFDLWNNTRDDAATALANTLRIVRVVAG